jgi:PAS domain S-box-containing protein
MTTRMGSKLPGARGAQATDVSALTGARPGIRLPSVRGESASAARSASANWPRELFDALPGSVVIVAPDSGQVLFANRAALELTGEESPVGRPASEWMPAECCRDTEGRRLAEEALPAVRAARGERVRGTMVTCETPRGERTLRATAQAVAAPDGAPAVLVSFEDVTELRAAQLGERLVGEDLRAILEGVADAVTAQGPDGSLVYANEAAVRVLGFPSAEALLAAPLEQIMARWILLTPEGEPQPLAELPGRRALMGEEPKDLLVQFIDRESGERRWSRIKAKPVRDADGSVRLAINITEDVTELKQVEQSQRFLADASRALADSLEYESTLTAIAHLAVPGVADWCAVDLVAEVPGQLDRVAVAHVDPGKVIWAREIAERYPADPRADRGAHQVLRTGKSQLWADIPEALIAEAAQDEEHLRLIRTLGMTSAMMVPMRVRDRVFGVISFVSAESGRRYGEADLRLAEDLALRAGTAVENARLYRARTTIARTLQASLLPPLLPEVPGVEAGALYRPAGEEHEVGGDFYDLFATTENHWFAVIGDVCGKGAEAAAVTALARYTIRAAAAQRSSPAAILRWVNEAMLREGSSRFCTIAVAHLDRSAPTTRLTVAVGGHPAPLVLRTDGSVEEAGAGGTLIGLVEDPKLREATTALAPGDAVLLYTDGVTEAEAPHRVWEPEELAEVVAAAAGATAQELVDHVANAALAGLKTPPRDDVAMLALRLEP